MLLGIVCRLARNCLFTQLDKPGDARLRSICESRLKQFMIAVHNYHTDNECFPFPFKTNDSGKRIQGRQMLVFPCRDQHELHDRSKLNEPGVSPHHRAATTAADKFAQTRLKYPAESGDTNRGSQTSFFAIVGLRSVWQAARMVRLLDITDRTAGTMCLFEPARTSTIKSVKRRYDGWDGSFFACLNFQRTSKTVDCSRRWIAAARMGGLF